MAMANPVEAVSASDGFTITKSDTTPILFDAIRVGTTAGDLVIRTYKGTTLTIPNVQIGETISCKGDRVMAATAAVGLTGWKY